MDCRSPGVMRSKPIKHRARDAGEPADLRFHYPNGPVAPGRLGAVRCRGPWVRRDPGVPRTLGFVRRCGMGDWTKGVPGALTNNTGDDACLPSSSPAAKGRTPVFAGYAGGGRERSGRGPESIAGADIQAPTKGLAPPP